MARSYGWFFSENKWRPANVEIHSYLRHIMFSGFDKNRWQLLSTNNETESFVVLDRLANKNRTYYVPNLAYVEVSDCFANVFTTNTKVMQINLLTSARVLNSVSNSNFILQ